MPRPTRRQAPRAQRPVARPEADFRSDDVRRVDPRDKAAMIQDYFRQHATARAGHASSRPLLVGAVAISSLAVIMGWWLTFQTTIGQTVTKGPSLADSVRTEVKKSQDAAASVGLPTTVSTNDLQTGLSKIIEKSKPVDPVQDQIMRETAARIKNITPPSKNNVH